MIRNASYVFSQFSNCTLITALGQLSKHRKKNMLETNLWWFRKFHSTQKRASSNYVDRLYKQKVDFGLLTRGDPVLEKKLKLIVLEVEDERYSGNPVPRRLNIKDYNRLLYMDDASDRKLYLTQLAQNEKEEEETEKPAIDNHNPYLIHNHIFYSLDHNTLFSHDTLKNSDLMLDTVASTGMMYGDNIIIDLSYDKDMEYEELRKCAGQIVSLLHMNRMILNPYNIHFCNVLRSGNLMGVLQSFLRKDLDDFLVNVHEESYLDIFDRNQLVYLSPNAKDELVKYNPDEIYIIGGVVDKEPVYTPLSLEKVKSDDLIARRLPVSEYINSVRASQSFRIDTTFQIIAAMNYYRDWSKAFKYLPRHMTRKRTNERTEFKWRNLHSALES